METFKTLFLLLLILFYTTAYNLDDYEERERPSTRSISENNNVTDNSVPTTSTWDLSHIFINYNQTHENYNHSALCYESQTTQATDFNATFINDYSHASTSSQFPCEPFIEASEVQSYNNAIPTSYNYEDQSEQFNQPSTSIQNIPLVAHQSSNNLAIKNKRPFKRTIKTAEEKAQNKTLSNRETQARTRQHNQRMKESHASNDRLIHNANQEFLRGGNPESILRELLSEYKPIPEKNKATPTVNHILKHYLCLSYISYCASKLFINIIVYERMMFFSITVNVLNLKICYGASTTCTF